MKTALLLTIVNTKKVVNNMKPIKELLNTQGIILDGAMGTMLQKEGLPLGVIPESFNITNPDVLKKIHKQYIDAGANVISANTFGASPIKLNGTGYDAEQIISSAIKLAKDCADGKAYVALDIGPLGEMLEPLGSLSKEQAYGHFKTLVDLGVKYGADLILIETMTDLAEAKCACLAAKENSDLPVICTMTFEQNGRTFTGCMPSAAALTLSPIADAVGVNCSLGPKELKAVVEEFLQFATVPVAVSPNAGLPVVKGDTVTYDIDAKEFSEAQAEFFNMGVGILGGCCGTTPKHIKLLSEKCGGKALAAKNYKPLSAVCCANKTVVIDRPRVIGERINPTGKKRFKQALAEKDFTYILEQAVSQIDAGADILDVNTGLPEIDEAEMLCKTVKEICRVTDIPLQIDSSDPVAIEKALRIYDGKAIVNSVNGEEKSMAEILPIVKKYGAAVVILTLDENGIPKKAQDRVDVAKKVMDRALALGIPKQDLFVDCLTLTVSAQQEDAAETLKAVKMVKEQLGVKTVLGVSNISFGLPCRENINETFLAQALFNGLDLPIINPNAQGMMKQIMCHNVIANIDINSEQYIKAYSEVKAEQTTEATEKSLIDIVVGGFKDKAYNKAKEMLKFTDSMELVDNHLIPALDIVGEKYEKGEVFLPQLIRSAETVKAAFNCIKETMTGNNSINKGTIVLATVKGDIHDIGKNIVKVILENYGFKVIDLGKDVPPKDIVSCVVENNITLVGLSALMTTTVKSMQETIELLKAKAPFAVTMVGGAVLNEDYADMIGAHYYVKDAKATAELARKHFQVM